MQAMNTKTLSNRRAQRNRRRAARRRQAQKPRPKPRPEPVITEADVQRKFRALSRDYKELERLGIEIGETEIR